MKMAIFSAVLSRTEVMGMKNDLSESFFTRDDPEIAVVITHNRDLIAFDGKVEQDYRFLNYVFTEPTGNVEACMYLDDTRRIQITVPLVGTAVHVSVLAYLQRRFDHISQLGGPEGYITLWSLAPLE